MVNVDPVFCERPRPAVAPGHHDAARYAIYFTPPRQSVWWLFGCAWLARDAITDTPVVPPVVAGFDADAITHITSAPRAYGFHATLKAPFRLAPGYRAQDVYLQAANLAQSLKPAPLPPLQLAAIDGFVALTFAAAAPGAPACHALAAQCVAGFDHLRARADAEELARRHAAGLAPREAHLLAAWGYPYVFDQFRFHFTLTGRLPAAQCERVIDTLRPLVEAMHAQTLAFDALSVFEQPAPGMPFVVTRRYGFGGEVEVYRE
jgi:putative phosphonate metabolism protein